MKARHKSRAKSRVQIPSRDKDPTLKQAVRAGKAREAKHMQQMVGVLSTIHTQSGFALRYLEKGNWMEAVESIAHTVTKAREIERLAEEY